MPIPPSIDALIEQLNQELVEIEQEATAGLNLIRSFLERFPENLRLIQFFSSFSNAMLFVDIERRRIQSVRENLTIVDIITDRDIQEAGEELGNELGRILETKMLVSNFKKRLEELQ